MWDTIGPLEKDELGYESIVVAINRFTRFIEMIPTRSVSAHDAAVALLQVCGLSLWNLSDSALRPREAV
eukprot:m.8770 g.8770  ORF g.8770 m.8770 type:complete len:69 (+) comp6732_c0_seq1:95-301(+)